MKRLAFLVLSMLFCLVSVVLAQDPNDVISNDVLTWLTLHWTDVLSIIAYIIAAASIVVKLTPTQRDDVILGRIIEFLKVLSLNKK